MGLTIERMEYGSKILGNAFSFEKAGDVLPWHSHDKYNDHHITIVGKGEFTMEVRGEEPCTIRSGDLIDMKPGTWHQFTSLTDDARLFNICKEELIVDKKRPR